MADHYRIEHVLGDGGMATVYLAEDLKHHRKVAVKVMRPELAETLGAERFLREIEIAAKLTHQNILPVYDSGAVDGVFYYVMPVVEGESLPARLSREKQLPVAEALRIAREVAEALAYAHKRGIVHRDIKPANILLSDGHALVADFGIARATGEGAKALTQTGLAIGTPHYMSPEQASGESNLDGRSDIYALGCVLYEMLAGEPPFNGPTAQVIIARSMTDPPRPLQQTRTALAPAIDTAVLRALAKAPADRYSTATEMANALTAAEETARTSSGATIVTTPARKVRPWQLAAAALLVLAAGFGGWMVLGAKGATAVRSVAVLPFETQGAASDAYFADGIVDELRDKLARLDKFNVIASASADQYRDTKKSVTDIASELRVDHVLMGRVRWGVGADGAKQVKVTTELIDGKTGKVTWRDSFDGDVADPFAIQARIATRVASALGVTVGQAQAQDLAGQATDNPEAYALYLKARAIPGNDPGSARAAAALYEQAVALDSNFVQAWGRLSVVSAVLFANGTRDPAIGRRSKEAMERTLRLAPDSSFSHQVAVIYHSNIGRDQVAAKREVARALELDPRNVEALIASAQFDFTESNYRAMFEKLSRAREIDPLAKGVLDRLIRAQLYLGQYREAQTTAAELMALEPTANNHMQTIVLAYIANADTAGARRALAELLQRVSQTELVAYFAGYQELAFLFSEKERALLFRLKPAAFDNDVAWWGQSLANAAAQRGDIVRAKAYADSSLAVAKQQIDASPDDPQLRMINAVMLNYVGRTAEALREADIAIADTAGVSRGNTNYVQLQYVRVLIGAGQQERALDNLEKLMQQQYYITPGYLRSDPLFKPLKGNARFEKLARGGIATPVD
ncbi:MAG: protein kinase [Gemmatimonadales bacterium]